MLSVTCLEFAILSTVPSETCCHLSYNSPAIEVCVRVRCLFDKGNSAMRRMYRYIFQEENASVSYCWPALPLSAPFFRLGIRKYFQINSVEFSPCRNTDEGTVEKKLQQRSLTNPQTLNISRYQHNSKNIHKIFAQNIYTKYLLGKYVLLHSFA